MLILRYQTDNLSLEFLSDQLSFQSTNDCKAYLDLCGAVFEKVFTPIPPEILQSAPLHTQRMIQKESLRSLHPPTKRKI